MNATNSRIDFYEFSKLERLRRLTIPLVQAITSIAACLSASRHWLPVMSALLLSACVGVPENIQPVTDFDSKRYLGKWYEIARLDHSFERGLTHVSATYEPRDDGGIRVINKGYAEDKESWKVAEGKAYFVESEDVGYLKVSFFGPFYGSYVVFKLDRENYQWAYVTSHNRKYLWLLARTPSVSDAIRQDFLNTAKTQGFDTDELIFVEQGTPGGHAKPVEAQGQ